MDENERTSSRLQPFNPRRLLRRQVLAVKEHDHLVVLFQDGIKVVGDIPIKRCARPPKSRHLIDVTDVGDIVRLRTPIAKIEFRFGILYDRDLRNMRPVVPQRLLRSLADTRNGG